MWEAYVIGFESLISFDLPNKNRLLLVASFTIMEEPTRADLRDPGKEPVVIRNGVDHHLFQQIKVLTYLQQVH